MPPLLPPVLSRFDLPEAELYAARLDGELFAIDECFAPIDEIDVSHNRGRSLAAILPQRLIAEQRSAAWVLGALDDPPRHHQVCADSAARYRCLGRPRLIVREVVLDETDLVTRGGTRVTTAIRTALDIARFSAEFGSGEVVLVRDLARIGGFSVGQAVEDLERRRRLPGKVRAAMRLEAALS